MREIDTTENAGDRRRRRRLDQNYQNRNWAEENRGRREHNTNAGPREIRYISNFITYGEEVLSEDEDSLGMPKNFKSPIFSADILGKGVDILVDSGSQVSAISEEFLKPIRTDSKESQLPVLPVSNTILSLAIGAKRQKISQQVFLPITVGSKSFEVVCMVVAGLNKPIIFGCDWLVNQKIVMDFHNMTLFMPNIEALLKISFEEVAYVNSTHFGNGFSENSDEDSSPPPSIDYSFDIDDPVEDPTFEPADQESEKRKNKDLDEEMKVQQWVDNLETEKRVVDNNNGSESVKMVDKPRFSHKLTKKKTICKFCHLEVTNFERHLEKNHVEYQEVRDLLSFPKLSIERRKIITLIRNSGNFGQYLIGNTIPKYRRNIKSYTEYYPCAFCKGLYSKKYLARHAKSCVVKDETRESSRFSHLSASQTLIACTLQRNNVLQKLRVRDEIFKTMKPDDISLVAKTDALICHFGEQYLKKHKRAQMATVCSNKMRELARLLIELRKATNDNDLKLEGVIHPKMFDTVIECAKRIGGYDPNEKTFRAPSLRAHIGTTLKQVSDILLHLILKQDSSVKCDSPEERIKAVKRFSDLVISQWTTEISSLAFKDLREKSGINLNYVTEVADKALLALRANSSDKKQFKSLTDAALVLTILYNRRRIGDVQYTKLDTFLQNFTVVNQDECLNAFSDSEKMLTKQYCRSSCKNIFRQWWIYEILQTWSHILIPISLGILILHIGQELMSPCVEYPTEIRSNKLGHTEKTPNEFYKLPQDGYQTAKISKLLILMDKGLGDKYKGKSLNEIDIDPEQDYAETESDIEYYPLSVFTETNNLPTTSTSRTEKELLHSREGMSNCKWKKAMDYNVVKKHFKQHIKKKQPQKNECEDLLKKYPQLFHNKNWVRIKTYVYNQYRNK
nr:unnamed protein product [Callosobruchus analis]